MKALKILALTAVVAAPLANADETSLGHVANPLPMEEIIVTASQSQARLQMRSHLHSRKPDSEQVLLQPESLQIEIEVSLPSLPPEIRL